MKVLLSLALLLTSLLAAGGAIKVRRTDAYLKRLQRLVHRHGLMRCLFYKDMRHLPDSPCFVKYHVSHRMEYFLSIISNIVVDVVYKKHSCGSFDERNDAQSCIKIVSLDFSKQFKLHIRTEEEKQVLIEIVTEFVKYFAYMNVRKVNDLQVNHEQKVRYRAPQELEGSEEPQELEEAPRPRPFAVNRLPLSMLRIEQPDQEDLATPGQDEDQVERDVQPEEDQLDQSNQPDGDLIAGQLGGQAQGQDLDPDQDQYQDADLERPKKDEPPVNIQARFPATQDTSGDQQPNGPLQKAILQALAQHVNQMVNKDGQKQGTDEDEGNEPQPDQNEARIPLNANGSGFAKQLPPEILARLAGQPNELKIGPVNTNELGPQANQIYRVPVNGKDLNSANGKLPFKFTFREEPSEGQLRVDRMMKQIVKMEAQPEQTSKLSLM